MPLDPRFRVSSGMIIGVDHFIGSIIRSVRSSSVGITAV